MAVADQPARSTMAWLDWGWTRSPGPEELLAERLARELKRRLVGGSTPLSEPSHTGGCGNERGRSGGPPVRVVGSVEIDRPASHVWAYVADYGNDPGWRAAVSQMQTSRPGPAEAGVTTHELLRLLGMTFRTDAIVDRVETGHRLQWRAADRQKQLRGSRLVEPTGPASSRFTEVVEGHLLGPLRPLEPLVAWLLRRQATPDLRRLKRLLEQPTTSAPTQDGTAT